MGNCLVMEKKLIKIVRNDGKVFEYRKFICVYYIFVQFFGYFVFDNNISCYFQFDVKFFFGRFYYFLLIIINKKKIKKVRFVDFEVKLEERLLSEEDE